MSLTPAKRRYRLRMSAAMALYVVLVLAASWTFKHTPIAGPAAWALALAPALPILAVIAAMGLYLKEETDEFQRAIVVECLLWAIGATLAVTTVWGFLEIYVAAPALSAFWAFPVFCAVMGLARPLVARRFA